ncbi:MAG: septation protein A [Alphaproteobacteria bacterium]|nr:septation protein A [Alphaproteobacteria bacterium]MDE2111023.1 septation protein A [Alphaproteobacteria bacterium]MDE2493816.1 septation protein A [Alphaproteobacteria bacterium]
MNSQLRRAILDFGPLLLFFTAYKLFDLYVATATIMAAAITAVGIGYWIDRKIHPMPVFTAIIVLVFGGLTLYLNNDMFIKMKPTMIYTLFGSLLIGGLYFKQPFAKQVLGVMAINLSEEGWRGLTWRFGLFFFGMAILNELIWRNFSNDIWVDFHVFGAITLTVLFSLSQTPFLLRHQIENETPGADQSES